MTPTNFSKGIAVTDVDLEWGSVAAASMYTVEYADNVDFIGSSTIMTANTTATIAGPLNNNETYFWRVYSDACGADQAADAIIREFKNKFFVGW